MDEANPLLEALQADMEVLLDKMAKMPPEDIMEDIGFYAGAKAAVDYVTKHPNALSNRTVAFLCKAGNPLTLLGTYMQAAHEEHEIAAGDIDLYMDSCRTEKTLYGEKHMTLTELRQFYEALINNSFSKLSHQWGRLSPDVLITKSGEIETVKLMRDVLLDDVGPKLASHLVLFKDPLKFLSDEWADKHKVLDKDAMKQRIWELIELDTPLHEDMCWPGIKMDKNDDGPYQHSTVFSVQLRNPANQKVAWLPYPATQDAYADMLDRLDLQPNDLASVEISHTDFDHKELIAADSIIRSATNLNELNVLAYMLVGARDDDSLYLVDTVLNSKHAPADVKGFINTLYNLQDFEIVDAHSQEALGKYAAEKWNIADSSAPDFDATAFGQKIENEMNGSLTKFGYLLNAREMDIVYHGCPEDVLNDEWLLHTADGQVVQLKSAGCNLDVGM